MTALDKVFVFAASCNSGGPICEPRILQTPILDWSLATVEHGVLYTWANAGPPALVAVGADCEGTCEVLWRAPDGIDGRPMLAGRYVLVAGRQGLTAFQVPS